MITKVRWCVLGWEARVFIRPTPDSRLLDSQPPTSGAVLCTVYCEEID